MTHVEETTQPTNAAPIFLSRSNAPASFSDIAERSVKKEGNERCSKGSGLQVRPSPLNKIEFHDLDLKIKRFPMKGWEFRYFYDNNTHASTWALHEGNEQQAQTTASWGRSKAIQSLGRLGIRKPLQVSEFDMSTEVVVCDFESKIMTGVLRLLLIARSYLTISEKGTLLSITALPGIKESWIEPAVRRNPCIRNVLNILTAVVWSRSSIPRHVIDM